MPGFLVALGPDGPIGYAPRVRIEETVDPGTGHPRRLAVTGPPRDLAPPMDIAVPSVVVTKGDALSAGPDFPQPVPHTHTRPGHR